MVCLLRSAREESPREKKIKFKICDTLGDKAKLVGKID
jgi:hypothetical protein